MTEYVGDNFQKAPDVTYSTQQGGHLAPDQTQVRIKLALTDTMDSNTSLVNTKNEDILRQNTMGMSITKPREMPDGSPIAELTVDRLFEKVRITDEEREAEREALTKRVFDSTFRQLIRYLEHYGGPTKLPVDARPPDEGFPPGVSVEALRGELGHNLWAVRNVLCALPSFTAPMRKMLLHVRSAKRDTALIKRSTLSKEHYAAAALLYRDKHDEGTLDYETYNLLATATNPLADALLLLLHQSDATKKKKATCGKLSFALLGHTAINFLQFAYDGADGPERRYRIQRYITQPLESLYTAFAKELFPDADPEQLRPLLTYGAALLLGISEIVIAALNDDSESPSHSQPRTIASMALILSDAIFIAAEALLRSSVENDSQRRFYATLISATILLANREVAAEKSLASLGPDVAYNALCLTALKDFADSNGKAQKQLAETMPAMAKRCQHYAILASKLPEITPNTLLDAFADAFSQLLGEKSHHLPRIGREVARLLQEWFEEVNPISEETSMTLYGQLSG